MTAVWVPPVDWRRAAVRDPQPCGLRGRPAILRHPETARPCHKTCSDAQAEPVASPRQRTLPRRTTPTIPENRRAA